MTGFAQELRITAEKVELLQDGAPTYSTEWLTAATIPDLAVTLSAQEIDFGDLAKDNALWWGRSTWNSPSDAGGVEYSYGYITALAGEASYDDITLGSIPAAADFLRIKVTSLTRTTSPTAPTPANMMTGALDPIPPIGKYFVAHDNFIPLEQANPIARAISFVNDSGSLKLRRIQSVGQDNLVDDCVNGWGAGNATTPFDTTTTINHPGGGSTIVATNLGCLTYGTAKGEPIYYLGEAHSGNQGTAMQRDYSRGGSSQLDLTDSTNFRSVYSLDAVIEPGYFKTDPVLGTPTQKSVLRAAYIYNEYGEWGHRDEEPGGTATSLAAVQIGLPASSRLVLVMLTSGSLTWDTGTNYTPMDAKATAVTIGGVAATKLAEGDPSSWIACSIWMATVPEGETADIDITWSNSNVLYTVLVYSLYNFDSATPVGTASGAQNGTEGTNLSETLATASGGFAFVIATHLDSSVGGQGPLLGGVNHPGYHALVIHFAGGNIVTAPCCIEAAMQGTDGSDIDLVMAGQTNRHSALCGVSLS